MQPGCAGGPAEGTCYIALGPYYSTFHVLRNPDPQCLDAFSWAGIVRDLDGDNQLELLMSAYGDDFGIFQNAGAVIILDH